jgi:hypothetical protein
LSNELGAVSDMSLQAKRFMSYIKRGITTFPLLYDNLDIILPTGAIPFMERFGDHTAGVALDCIIQVFEDLNACDFYPSPTLTAEPTITPTMTPTITPSPTRVFYYYDILLCGGGVGPYTKIRSNTPISLGTVVSLAALPECYEVISVSDSSGFSVSNFAEYPDCNACLT